MSALYDATIRYRDAGLCDEVRRSLLAVTLEESDASISALDRAVADGTPLTLAQVDALSDPDVTPDIATRYGIAFGGFDPRINDFAMMRDEIAEVTARAIERGTPMTEDEIVWLGRNVEADVLY